jgi:acyl-CoA synthetase (NDP forming)/N-acetylglutamate synthase-like GNAT family acetyltransferase
MSAPAVGAGGVYALLTDGTTIQIRPAAPSDLDAVKAMHEEMSPDNIYLRFFSMSRLAGEREAERICREPGPDHFALLALLEDAVIGCASFEPAGKPGVAEVALAVADNMHGHGVGTLLLEHLVSAARSRGVHTFTASVLSENTLMLKVFADAGLHAQRRLAEEGVVELAFDVPADTDMSWETYLEAVGRRESHADVASLRPLLTPQSVAVVGASRRSATVGRAILHNIITAGYAGRLYPVNPHATHIEGIPCLRSVAELPGPVDLAVVAVPPAAVAGVAEQCGLRGVKSLVVITSGLDEGQGADLLAACRRHGMRLVGPNCFGIAVPAIGLDATFAARRAAPGVAGLVMQSGGLGFALAGHLSRLGAGISSFASVGNKLDVSSNDLLTWWEQDGQTRLAVLYIESFGNPRKFARTARRVGQKMPLVTVEAGRSEAGQHAAASHTAAVATPLATREALFAQAGIVVAADFGELLDTVALFAAQPVPAGRRVAIVSNVGGAGVLAADACTEAGLTVHATSAPARRRLARIVPPGGAVTGPVDTAAAISEAGFRACLELAAADGADAVIAVALPTAATGNLSKAIRGASVGVPLAAVLLDQAETVRLLPREPAEAGSVPAYAYPEGAARALSHAAGYGAWRIRRQDRIPRLTGLKTAGAQDLVRRFLKAAPRGGWLPPGETSELLASYGIPIAETRRAGDAEAAVLAAADLGWPVVLKADVTSLVHKTEAGAVKLGLHTAEEVRAAFAELETTFGARMAAVLIQPMITGGVEVLAGIRQDPVFGPLVVFGLGGVATEVLADHQARLAPLSSADADDMIHGLRAAPLLSGYRNAAPADVGGLRDLLLRVSRLAGDLPEVTELDLNPVIARPDRVVAVDGRVRLMAAEPYDPFLRRLR